MSINIAQLTKEVNALNHKIDMLNKQINNNEDKSSKSEEVIFEIDDGRIVEIDNKAIYLFYNSFIHSTVDLYKKIDSLYDKNKNNILILEIKYDEATTYHKYIYNLNVYCTEQLIENNVRQHDIQTIYKIYHFGNYIFCDDPITDNQYYLFNMNYFYFKITGYIYDGIVSNNTELNGLNFQARDDRFDHLYYKNGNTEWLYKINSETLTYSTIDNVKIKMTYVIE